MNKLVAIVIMILFTSVYFAPVVNAVVVMNGETHICVETGKVCKNKKMCMKKQRGEKHAKATHHESATSTHHGSNKKSETPNHKNCKERLSCGSSAGAMSIISERLMPGESLISVAVLMPLTNGLNTLLYEEGVRLIDAEISILERPPKTP